MRSFGGTNSYFITQITILMATNAQKYQKTVTLSWFYTIKPELDEFNTYRACGHQFKMLYIYHHSLQLQRNSGWNTHHLKGLWSYPCRFRSTRLWCGTQGFLPCRRCGWRCRWRCGEWFPVCQRRQWLPPWCASCRTTSVRTQRWFHCNHTAHLQQQDESC